MEIYGAFFSTDVLEEYTRPARILRNGLLDVVPAISDRHTIEVPEWEDGRVPD